MQESNAEDPFFDKDKILEISNYKDIIASSSSTKPELSNASKEEYSIINLALILSNEKKLKNLIAMIKGDLMNNIENNNNTKMLNINITDPSIILDETLDVPTDDKFVDDANDTTSKHFNLTPFLIQYAHSGPKIE